MEKCFLLFRDDKIYIKTSKNRKVVEYSFDNPVAYPNVPLYFNIFHNEKVIKDFREFIKNNIDSNSLLQSIFSKKVFLLIPDDVTSVTEIEKRAFDEFATMIFGRRGVILGSECAFVAPFEEKSHICVSRTCRMIILSYIKDNNIFMQKFIEDKEYTSEELYTAICELQGGIDYMPKIYLNGVHLSQYSDIGIIIDSLDLINNFEIIINTLKIK